LNPKNNLNPDPLRDSDMTMSLPPQLFCWNDWQLKINPQTDSVILICQNQSNPTKLILEPIILSLQQASIEYLTIFDKIEREYDFEISNFEIKNFDLKTNDLIFHIKSKTFIQSLQIFYAVCQISNEITITCGHPLTLDVTLKTNILSNSNVQRDDKKANLTKIKIEKMKLKNHVDSKKIRDGNNNSSKSELQLGWVELITRIISNIILLKSEANLVFSAYRDFSVLKSVVLNCYVEMCNGRIVIASESHAGLGEPVIFLSWPSM
jgi:hypothetical protein